MELRQLSYLVAVAESGSITAAAESLYISQGALSQSLRALATELEVELIHRVGRGIALTPQGEVLVREARLVLSAVDDLTDLAEGIGKLDAGLLVIAAMDDLAADPLVDLIAGFRSEYPNIAIEFISCASTNKVTDLVLLGDVDMGLSYLPIDSSRLAKARLGRHIYHLVEAPSVDPLRSLMGDSKGGGKVLDAQLDECLSQPLMLGLRGTNLRDTLEALATDLGVELTIDVELSFWPTVMDFILAGVGSAFLPSGLAQEAYRRGAVVKRPTPEVSISYGILWRDEAISQASTAFLKYLMERDHV